MHWAWYLCFQWSLFIAAVTSESAINGPMIMLKQKPSRNSSITKSIQFECEFTQPVDYCLWTNEFINTKDLLDENVERILYRTKALGTNACFLAIDMQRYDPHKDGIRCLGMQQLRTQHLNIGETVTLQCLIKNNRVNCVWQRNNVEVKAGEGYSYSSGVVDGVANCSLTIPCVSPIDFAHWECASKEMHHNAREEIYAAYLLYDLTATNNTPPIKCRREISNRPTTPLNDSKANEQKTDTWPFVWLIVGCVQFVIIAILIAILLKYKIRYILHKGKATENISTASTNGTVNEFANPRPFNELPTPPPDEQYYTTILETEINVDRFKENRSSNSDSAGYLIPIQTSHLT